jgi:hypothetical protein
VNIPKEALIKSVTQSELPLIWGIYAPKVSIPLEGKVPTSSGGPDLRSPTLGTRGHSPLVQAVLKQDSSLRMYASERNAAVRKKMIMRAIGMS